MAYPFVAEVRIFFGNFAPKGWALCEGQILPISQNTALFSLLGTTYGGNGQNTFALPDLRGRAPGHASSNIGLGEIGGGQTLSRSPQRSPPSVTSHEALASAPAPGVALGDSALVELQRIIDKLGESQDHIQQLIESYPEIVSYIKRAASYVREYISDSRKGEHGRAGESLKALIKTIETLTDDPKVVPEFRQVLERLSALYDETHHSIVFQSQIARYIEEVSAHAREYQSRMSKGQLSEAGQFLERLVETINELESMSDSNRVTRPLPPVARPGNTSPPNQMKKGSNPRFLAVTFMVALQGIFPPRT